MAYIVDTSVCFPENYYRQEEISSFLRQLWSSDPQALAKMDRFHQNTLVEGRYLALPLEAYGEIRGFGQRNDAWIDHALDLSESVVAALLEKTGLQAEDIHLIISTTTTGLSTPSIEARLMNRVPFSKHLKRLPLFGLGCLGGAAGIARAADYLKGYPQQAAVLFSTELCSLTIQHDDLSIANIISTGLFGDGAAAVLIVGDEHPLAGRGKPQVIGTHSVLFSGTERVMGWDMGETGFKVVLSPDVPAYAEGELRPHVADFLEQYQVGLHDIQHWIAHPGGPKVMEGLQAGLDLPKEAFALSWESLTQVGNLSSASVLAILGDMMSRYQPQSGTYGFLLALGPGFSAEFVLLQW